MITCDNFWQSVEGCRFSRGQNLPLLTSPVAMKVAGAMHSL